MSLVTRLKYFGMAVSIVFFWLLSGSVCGAEEKAIGIISGFNVRMRDSPSISGKEVLKPAFGETGTELERTAQTQTIGSATAPWIKIRISNGREGWVFGGFIESSTPSTVETDLGKVIRRRLENEKECPFIEISALYEFIERKGRVVKGRENQAFYDFCRLVALKKCLAAIPIMKQTEGTFAPFLKGHQEEIVYSEPAGSHFVVSQKFWDACDRYKDLPIADDIAWEGTQNPLPGETEGYLPAVLSVVDMTDGNYLRRFPKGKHVPKVLSRIAEYLGYAAEALQKNTSGYFLEKEDMVSFPKELAQFVSLIESLSDPEKHKVLGILDTIGKNWKKGLNDRR